MKLLKSVPFFLAFIFLSFSCQLDINDQRDIEISSRSTILTPRQSESFPQQFDDNDTVQEQDDFDSSQKSPNLKKNGSEDIYDISFEHRNSDNYNSNDSHIDDNDYYSSDRDDESDITQDDDSIIVTNVSNKCLIGIHGRADGSMQEADYTTIQTAKKIEAVKLLTNADPSNIDRLLQINSQMFIIYRIYLSISNRDISPSQFVNDTHFDIQRAYDKGVRYFEVHNEPNLYIEGLSYSWKNGIEFGTWFKETLSLLKQNFPLAKFGYPGLSPGQTVQDIRLDENIFFNDSINAVNASDWLAIHTYFVDINDLQTQITRVKDYLQRFPNKTIMITEFSNPITSVSKTDKGNQYVEYYKALRNLSGLKAAFSFVISASSYFAHETWREENGSQTAIPSILANAVIP